MKFKMESGEIERRSGDYRAAIFSDCAKIRELLEKLETAAMHNLDGYDYMLVLANISANVHSSAMTLEHVRGDAVRQIDSIALGGEG